jgi:hypothetical protein
MLTGSMRSVSQKRHRATGARNGQGAKPVPVPRINGEPRQPPAIRAARSAYFPRSKVTNPSRFGMTTFGNVCAFIVASSATTPLRLST